MAIKRRRLVSLLTILTCRSLQLASVAPHRSRRAVTRTRAAQWRWATSCPAAAQVRWGRGGGRVGLCSCWKLLHAPKQFGAGVRACRCGDERLGIEACGGAACGVGSRGGVSAAVSPASRTPGRNHLPRSWELLHTACLHHQDPMSRRHPDQQHRTSDRAWSLDPTSDGT